MFTNTDRPLFRAVFCKIWYLRVKKSSNPTGSPRAKPKKPDVKVIIMVSQVPFSKSINVLSKL